MFKRYYKIDDTNDYSHICVESLYRKGKGYVASVEPMKLSYYNPNDPEHSSFMMSVIFGADYFNYYKGTETLIFPCQRSSKKKELEADEWIRNNALCYLNQYIDKVVERGGVEFTVTGDKVIERNS